MSAIFRDAYDLNTEMLLKQLDKATRAACRGELWDIGSTSVNPAAENERYLEGVILAKSYGAEPPFHTGQQVQAVAKKDRNRSFNRNEQGWENCILEGAILVVRRVFFMLDPGAKWSIVFYDGGKGLESLYGGFRHNAAFFIPARAASS